LKWTRSFFLIAFGVFALSFNQGITESISQNFFRQTLGFGGSQMGYYTAAREFVGFMIVAVAALTVSFSVSKVAGVALVITSVGFAGFSQVHSFPQLVMMGMLGSLGFHTWLQVYTVLGLSLADQGYEGRVLGQLSSIGSIGTMLSMIVTLLIVEIVGIRQMYIIAGALMLPAGIGLFFVPKSPRLVRQQGFVWKRRYWLYYLLNFLDGCRGQIAMTFALFTLVDVYQVRVEYMTVLLITSAIICWFAAPKFGAWIDRIGEKPVLMLCYGVTAPAFLAFAFIPSALVFAAMYIVYMVFGLGMMARNTYLKKIADPQDVSPSIAMGVSVMHVSAVVVPITGSLLWQMFGYQMVFLLGFVFIILSMIATQFIEVPALAPALTSGSANS
jgi:MFS family permease